MNIDFTAYKHPVLAVPCTHCGRKAGQWCERPSEHITKDFHKDRKDYADRKFIEQHGETAWIEQTDNGWLIHPTGYKPKMPKPDLKQVELEL